MRADHDRRWRDEVAAYALDALADDDLSAFEQHLAGCERCRADLSSLRVAVETLPASVEPRRPPRRLRRRLLAEVRGDARREPRGADPRASGARWRPALALTAVAALLVGGLIGYVGGGSGDEQGQIVVAARATAEAPPLAAATVSYTGDTAVLETSGLPPAGAGNVYQAWIRTGEEIAPSSVFVIDRAGNGVAAIPQGISGADELMVTREPSGGSESPTPPLLLRASLD